MNKGQQSPNPGKGAISVLTRYTFLQLLYRKRTIGMAVFMLIPIVLAFVWLAKEKDPKPLEFFTALFYVLFLHILLPLVTLILSVNIFNSEFKNHTMAYLFVRPIPRWAVFIGKFFGLLLAELLVILPSVLITFFLILSKAEAIHYWDDLAGFIIITILGITVYSSFFIMLGTRFKHPLLLGIVVAFFWESTISTFSTTIAKLTGLYHLVSIGREFIDEPPFSLASNHSEAYVSFLVILGICIVCAALSIYFLNKKELE